MSRWLLSVLVTMARRIMDFCDGRHCFLFLQLHIRWSVLSVEMLAFSAQFDCFLGLACTNSCLLVFLLNIFFGGCLLLGEVLVSPCSRVVFLCQVSILHSMVGSLVESHSICLPVMIFLV